MEISGKPSPEEMVAFFDADAEGYDDFTQAWENTKSFYERAARAIDQTSEPITILDLGIGTGFELPMIFARAPYAQIVGVDLSTKMLEQLRKRHTGYLSQITLIQRSFLTLPFAANAYDYVIAIASMHHFLEDTRLMLYQKIRQALSSSGCYIEADKVALPEREGGYRNRYMEKFSLVADPISSIILIFPVP